MEPGFSFIASFDHINVLPRAWMDHESNTFVNYLMIIMKLQDSLIGEKLQEVYTMKAYSQQELYGKCGSDRNSQAGDRGLEKVEDRES